MKKLLLIIGLVALSGCSNQYATKSDLLEVQSHLGYKIDHQSRQGRSADGLYHVEMQCGRVTVYQAFISVDCAVTDTYTASYECDEVQNREYGAVCFLGVPNRDVVIEFYEGRNIQMPTSERS